MKRTLLLFVLLASTALAQTRIDLQSNDNLQVILERQIGQPVELRLRSGEKIAGKLEKQNEEFVHLTSLTGAEFFDALVSADEIAAIVVRARTK